jgi:spermidine synthase
LYDAATDEKLAAVSPHAAGDTGSLFLVSVLGLFLELLLIRWLGTELQVFAYLQNVVLVVCFLGLGMGCLTCRQPVRLRSMLAPLAVVALLLAVPITWSTLQKLFSYLLFLLKLQDAGLSMLGHATGKDFLGGALGLAAAFLLMMLVWDAFVPLGRLLGRLMNDHPHTIWAYSANVAGSLVGIGLFVLLSALSLPPWTWMVTLVILVAMLAARLGLWERLDFALCAALVVLGWFASMQSSAIESRWSPYQKLVLSYPEPGVDYSAFGDYIIQVNNGPYQGMLNLDPENVRANPERYPPELAGLSQYDLPARLHPGARNALIVGAGSGNDAAGLLRHGIPSITAVDIDPMIFDMGKRYHPEHPYSAPGVQLVCDDARSFFATCTERYDLIVFGLLDAHTANAMAARLDHYVYTLESIQHARSLLAPGGTLVLTFEALRAFMPERMFETLTAAFGHEPVYYRIPPTQYGWGGVQFAISDDQPTLQARIDADDRLAAQIRRWQDHYTMSRSGLVPPATDDWPYIYLIRPQLPPLVLVLIVMLVLLTARGLRRLQTPGLFRNWERARWHFFFLGAAFLLLEVQNVNKAAVVLGNTWYVNAVIIAGILCLALVANVIAACWPRLPLGPVYVLLCGSSVALYFVDLSRFAFLPFASKAVLVGVLTSLPVLFSGIVFIRSFAAAREKDLALGANLIGALVGGLLQSVTFLIGIRALLLLVAALYTAAYLTRPTRKEADVAVPAPVDTQAVPAN